MKKITIEIPEGYIIDKENSSDDTIKLKKQNDLNYVNLGLPSGTLWSDRNVGADSPEEYGEYLTWDEAKHYNLPSIEQIKELINCCNWIWITKNSTNGYIVIGKNGNYIFLSAAGRSDDTLYNFRNSRGDYWSRSLGNPHLACYLYFNSGDIDWDFESCSCKQSVRPILR